MTDDEGRLIRRVRQTREGREVVIIDNTRRDRPERRFSEEIVVLERPALRIIVNGGIAGVDEAIAHLGHVDGAMLGRAAYHDAYVLHRLDARLNDTPERTRDDLLLAYMPYMQDQLDRGVPLKHMTRHLLGLYLGERGGRAFRQVLSEGAHRSGGGGRGRAPRTGGGLAGEAREHRVRRVLRDAQAAGERQVPEVEVARAPAEVGRVEGDHDRLAAARLGPPDEAGDEVVVTAPVELVPVAGTAQLGGDVLHGHRRLGAARDAARPHR